MDNVIEKKYLTDKEFSELLGISIGRLRNKVSGGENLPRRIEPNGCRTRLWPAEEVYMWLDKYLISDSVIKK